MARPFQDRNGKFCTAKSVYVSAFIVCIVKVLIGGMSYGDWSAQTADYSGMALLLGALGAVYYGRTKDKN